MNNVGNRAKGTLYHNRESATPVLGAHPFVSKADKMQATHCHLKRLSCEGHQMTFPLSFDNQISQMLHSAGIWIPTFTRTTSPSFVGLYIPAPWFASGYGVLAVFLPLVLCRGGPVRTTKDASWPSNVVAVDPFWRQRWTEESLRGMQRPESLCSTSRNPEICLGCNPLLCWLVVSNMAFIFHHTWDNPSHWLIWVKQDG